MNKKISLGATITLMIMAAAVTFSMTMIYYMDVFNGKVYNLKERETMYSKLPSWIVLYAPIISMKSMKTR